MSRLSVLAPVRVVSHSTRRREVAPSLPAPDAGSAWGSASAFDFSQRPSDFPAEIVDGGGGAGGEGLPAGMRSVAQHHSVRGVEQFREVTLETVVLAGQALEVEGIRSVTFGTGTRQIRHEARKVRGSYTSITPTIEHRAEYLRLVFPFTAELRRGDPPPPDTPPLPDLENVYGS